MRASASCCRCSTALGRSITGSASVAGADTAPLRRPFHFGDSIDVPRHQLQRRPRGAARAGAAPGRRRDARLARQRHVGDGDEPPRQGVHRHPRRGRGAAARAAGDPGELQGALHAGRRDRRERDRADEHAARQGERRLHPHRRVVEEVDRRGEEVRARSTSPRAARRAASPASRRARPGSSTRTRPTSTSAPTRRSAASSTTSRPTSAPCRWSPTCRATSCRGRSTSRSTA